MREGWEVKKLGDVCSYDKTKYIGNHLPYVGLEHIQSNTGKFLGSFDAVTVKSSTFHFSDKHLLYGRLRPYLNKVLIPDFEGHCSTEIFPIKMGEKVLREFLYYWFISETTVNKINATWTGARMPRANMNEVINFSLPIPPLPEQTQIVKTLDLAFAKLDQAKANLEKNLHNAQELFQSKLNEVFSQRGEGWEEKRLEELSPNKKAIVSGPFGSNLKVADYRDSGVPIIRLQNVGKGHFIEKDIKYIEKEKAEELKSHSFVIGDIVLAKLGIPIGKTCIIPDSFNNGIILADIVRIRPSKELVNYEFLEYFLNTSLSVSQLTKNISGATRPRVNLTNVRNIIVPIPSLTIQNEILIHITNLDNNIQKLEAHYQQKLTNLEELKKSILQKAFAGELT